MPKETFRCDNAGNHVSANFVTYRDRDSGRGGWILQRRSGAALQGEHIGRYASLADARRAANAIAPAA